LVDQQFSLGAFIVSGGELPALMAADSVVRHIPGALGNGESLLNESFSERFDGGLEEDLYTRPNETLGLQVPDVLTSGDHLQIDKWKQNNRSKESPACDS
jgi:tRNA (guanine37-N1)-methyltransferase